MNDNYHTGHVGWSPDYNSKPTLPPLKSLIPSDAASGSASSVLRELEWSKTYSYCTGWPCCPICKGIKPGHGADEAGNLPDNQGHRDGCRLAAALYGQNARAMPSGDGVANESKLKSL